MDEWIVALQEWGVWGLVLASFTEAFCSPILPDVVLIPLALAQPEEALFYGFVATAASVSGGFVGYFLGKRLGVKAARKLLPESQLQKLKEGVEGNALWAVLLAVMSPFPYKCITIAAGAVVQSDASGRAITLAAGVASGRARDAAAAAGDIIRILR